MKLVNKPNLLLGLILVFGAFFFFISDLALAEAASAASSAAGNAASGNDGQMGQSGFAQIIMIGVFVLACYFIIFLPQSKRAKAQRALIQGLQKGDEILTSGGIVGRVSKISDDFLMINISEGIEVALQKQAVAALLPKGTFKSIG